MSTIEQIERLIEQLPSEDFTKLAAWVEQRRGAPAQTNGMNSDLPSSPKYPDANTPSTVRDHSAFLNGYAPEDEGLYDNAASR
ncbi:MAG: hypothetical protein EXS31_00295 [Pedosphaera sp.]|nr:hypothetical protein [Pedosphaera sp.]